MVEEEDDDYKYVILQEMPRFHQQAQGMKSLRKRAERTDIACADTITKSASAGYSSTSQGLGHLARPVSIAMYCTPFNTIEVRLVLHCEGIPCEVEDTLQGGECLARSRIP
jgi:hypothetical protein